MYMKRLISSMRWNFLSSSLSRSKKYRMTIYILVLFNLEESIEAYCDEMVTYNSNIYIFL